MCIVLVECYDVMLYVSFILYCVVCPELYHVCYSICFDFRASTVLTALTSELHMQLYLDVAFTEITIHKVYACYTLH